MRFRPYQIITIRAIKQYRDGKWFTVIITKETNKKYNVIVTSIMWIWQKSIKSRDMWECKCIKEIISKIIQEMGIIKEIEGVTNEKNSNIIKIKREFEIKESSIIELAIAVNKNKWKLRHLLKTQILNPWNMN